MNPKVVLSFSYNGYHKKNYKILIDPVKHLQMLLAAIECANPNNKYEVIVSAINFDFGNMSKCEKKIALEIYKKTKLIVSKNNQEDHQIGAAISIAMAIEAAIALDSKYLIHLAEDILVCDDFVDYFIRNLSDCDYVGTHWMAKDKSMIKKTLNTQVFGCDIPRFNHFKINEYLTYGVHKNLEAKFFKILQDFGLKYKVGASVDNAFAYPENRVFRYQDEDLDSACIKLYDHCHDVSNFRKLAEERNVTWFEPDNVKFLL